MARKRIAVVASAGGLFVVAAVICGLLLSGVWRVTEPERSKFPVRGVDVSHYQGDIDWKVLATQDVSFAFIKATEGSNGVDERFEINWEQAQAADVRVGAYHFFSFESAGAEQAANFVSAVPKHSGMLPPVVDLEYYGDFFLNPPDVAQVWAELQKCLKALESAYGVRPIIYLDADMYHRYVENRLDYPIWIRDIVGTPNLPGKSWIFWQYSGSGKLDGYTGAEPFIDLNVFNGSFAEFDRLGLK